MYEVFFILLLVLLGTASGEDVYQPMTIDNPTVPFIHEIPEGMSPGRVIYIVGVPSPNAARFNINLYCGPNCFPVDLPLHIDVRFNWNGWRNTVVLNSRKQGAWEKLERPTSFPFEPSVQFEIKIVCEPSSFKVYVNNQYFVDFLHRVNLKKATHISVHGGTRLTQVRFEEQPLPPHISTGPSVCGKTHQDPSGTFKAPGYPDSYYDKMRCGQTFEAGWGQVVELTFSDFDVETATGCKFDRVKIYDGPDRNSPLIGTYCGTAIPGSVRSTGRYLYLYFYTDTRVTGKGFLGTYKIVNNVSLSLIGGSSQSEGTVQVEYSGSSGVICDDRWNIEDANVVCRMLGYSRALSAVTNNQYSYLGKTEDIYFNDFQCSGNESSLLDCPHSGFREHNCGVGETAGVLCEVETLQCNPNYKKCADQSQCVDRWFFCDGDEYDCDDGSDELGCDQCTAGFVPRSDICYRYIKKEMTWSAADNTCKGLGAHLAEPRTQWQIDGLKHLIRHKLKDVWLGATDRAVEGEWVWTYSNASVDGPIDWNPSKPKETSSEDDDCLEINHYRAKTWWNGIPCNHRNAFVCQKEMATKKNDNSLIDHLLESRADHPQVYAPPTSGSPHGPVVVGVSMSLINILKSRTKTGEVELLARISLKWNDPSLSWDPELFGNVTSQTLPRDAIWTPDIARYYLTEPSESLAPATVRVSYDGQVINILTERMSILCFLQKDGICGKCPLALFSWTQDANALDLRADRSRIDVSRYYAGSKFSVRVTRVSRREVSQDTETRVKLEMSFSFCRKNMETVTFENPKM